LVNADVIVGFQTTALLEALLLDRDVIYTCWGDAYEACKDAILPYEQYEGALRVARSPRELEAGVLGSAIRTPARSHAERLRPFEHFLGPSDGRAAQRTLAALERVAGAYRPKDPLAASALRQVLRDRRRDVLSRELLRSACALAIDAPVGWCVGVLGRLLHHEALERRGREQSRQRLRHSCEVLAVLRGQPLSSDEVTGYRASPWVCEGKRRLRQWVRARRDRAPKR
jgi:hypothetical protein